MAEFIFRAKCILKLNKLNSVSLRFATKMPPAKVKKASKEAPQKATKTSKEETAKKASQKAKKEPKVETTKQAPVILPDIEDSFTASQSWEPDNWKIVLENIQKMRAESNAPVDTKGCDKCADEEADEKTQRFHKLVALMLSSQTKDEVTFGAMQRLKNVGLTPENIIKMKPEDIQEMLKPVGFHKNKTKYLQQTSQILIDKYDSDIPNNIKELVALPGVGPKMAHICMATAWNEVSGIGVDVHVHRISNRLNWVQKQTKQPEQTRVALEEWLPRDLWREVNYLLVGFGQTVCTAVRPHCNQCLNRDICPSAEKGVRKKVTAPVMDEGVPGQSSDIFSVIKKGKFTKKKMQI